MTQPPFAQQPSAEPPPGQPQYGQPQYGQPQYGQPPPGSSQAAMVVPRFAVRQRITVMVNRYEVWEVAPDGSERGLLAMAQQKRLKLKEEVVFTADEARTRPVFSFRARQRLDVHAEHDVFDEQGRVLGTFSKRFGASLLRSTWELEAPGLTAVGRERRPFIAILRRVWTLIPYLGDVWVPFVFHFDFVDTATGAPVLVVERRKSIRDRYDVSVPDPRLDFRVAASMAVALDALQSR
ncbi:hypothetical protein [Geodermatophilus maliterrae]|uniref:Uncharacterized protein n=1 Tax=Geodermatophilus maliterrae TaxID=3162531 RepID=A0ABV3XD38_9ACTN